MSSHDEISTVSGLGSEVGFEAESLGEPTRVSGFLSVGLGLIGLFSFIGIPVLLFPLVGIVLGMIALRRCEGKRPLGTGAAKLGLLLCAGGAACGIAVPWLKAVTLGGQAEQFSRQYIELVAQGNDYLALELQKVPAARLPASASLRQHYELNPDNHGKLDRFRIHVVNRAIRDFGPGADWQLDRPVKIDYHFGREQVDVVWRPPSGDRKLQIFLEYVVDDNGIGQWHVDNVQWYRERLVAPRVL